MRAQDIASQFSANATAAAAASLVGAVQQGEATAAAAALLGAAAGGRVQAAAVAVATVQAAQTDVQVSSLVLSCIQRSASTLDST